jgi:hypothetical protein
VIDEMLIQGNAMKKLQIEQRTLRTKYYGFKKHFTSQQKK